MVSVAGAEAARVAVPGCAFRAVAAPVIARDAPAGCLGCKYALKSFNRAAVFADIVSAVFVDYPAYHKCLLNASCGKIAVIWLNGRIACNHSKYAEGLRPYLNKL